ncbi:MAG: TIGR03751 family conjugal transfer lipoprotein [Geminicoccaceae bacterium]
MRRIAVIALALSISACTHVDDLIPQGGPTMLEIYNGHLQKTGAVGTADQDVLAAARREAEARVSLGNVKVDPLTYTRDVRNEIDNLFPTLENPTLVMHVFPHLATDERLPVPGYSTSFPLFERVEFALPGETAQSNLAVKPKIRFIGVRGD